MICGNFSCEEIKAGRVQPEGASVNRAPYFIGSLKLFQFTKTVDILYTQELLKWLIIDFGLGKIFKLVYEELKMVTDNMRVFRPGQKIVREVPKGLDHYQNVEKAITLLGPFKVLRLSNEEKRTLHFGIRETAQQFTFSD